MHIRYTTEAVVEGGRAGHGRTADGRRAVELSVPKALGGEGGPGTNPEQLCAVEYAACFHSELLAVAQGRTRDAADSTVTAQVGIGPTGRDGCGVAVALALHAPHLSRVDAEDLRREPTRAALPRTPRVATSTSRSASTAYREVSVISPKTEEETTMSNTGLQALLTPKDERFSPDRPSAMCDERAGGHPSGDCR
jgi:Ohr subfamily peroxiredoxin